MTPSDVVIAPLAAEDVEAAAALFASAVEDGGGQGWTASAVAQAIGERGFGVVARTPEAVLGAAIALAAGDDAEIANIAVTPPSRRQGLGARLLQTIVAAAEMAGYRRLVLEVAADNAAAIDLYLANNFEEVGVRPEYYLRRGRRIDAKVMARPLAAFKPCE